MIGGVSGASSSAVFQAIQAPAARSAGVDTDGDNDAGREASESAAVQSQETAKTSSSNPNLGQNLNISV